MAGLGPIRSEKIYAVKRGSSFLEQFSDTVATGVSVVAYGSGRMPIFDGADIVPIWTKTAGRTNIWQATVTTASVTGSFPSLWEDAIRLRWIASLALLDAVDLGLAARFYAATTSGTSVTLYVNRNPGSNGKTYETATRLYGLLGGVGWTAYNIHTRRQLHNDGSLNIDRAYGCLAEDGTKHNLWANYAEDCISWKHDWADRSNSTLFITYLDSGAGRTAEFLRCITKGEVIKVAAAIANGQAIDGFYMHTAGGGAGNNWNAGRFVDCAAYGAVTAFGAANVNAVTVTRPYATECATIVNVGATVSAAITDPYYHSPSSATVQTVTGVVNGSGGAVLPAVDGLRAYVSAASNTGDIYGDVALTGSVIVRQSGQAGYRFLLNGNSDSAIQSSHHNIIYGPSAGNDERGLCTGPSGSADDNVYWNTGLDFQIGAAVYQGAFATYQAANPTFDTRSVMGDPLLVDPANGNFSLQSASPAIALGAGLARPSVTYTAIPSDAALAAM